MRLFNRKNDSTDLNDELIKVPPPKKSRGGFLGLFRRSSAEDEPATIPPPQEPDFTPPAPPTEQEQAKKARRSIFSRRKKEADSTATSKEKTDQTRSSRKRLLLGIMGNLLLICFLGLAIVSVNFYSLFQQIVSPFLHLENPNITVLAVNREFSNSYSAESAAVVRATADAQQAAIMVEAQAIAQQYQVELLQTVEKRRATEAVEIVATQSSSLDGRTATAMLVQETEVAFLSAHNATSTSIASDMNIASQARGAVATTESANIRSAAIARTMEAQAGQSTTPPDSTGNCTTPAFIFGLVFMAAVVRQRQP